MSQSSTEFGTLYIVATPIGNLDDITLRALDVLKSVDLIAAEDTRHTGQLLQHYQIKQSFISLHDHNEQQQAQVVINKLKQGQSIALVSDAGTPLINDPGYHLVEQCRAQQIQVVPIPGACAAITALCAAGLPSDRFSYEGFLAAKNKARNDQLTALKTEPRTLIFYESTHRLMATLQAMQAIFGADRKIVLAKELTKTWETFVSRPIAELIDWLEADPNRCKGEFVLMVAGYKPKQSDDATFSPQVINLLERLRQELPLKTAAAITAETFGLKKNQLYQFALQQTETE